MITFRIHNNNVIISNYKRPFGALESQAENIQSMQEKHEQIKCTMNGLYLKYNLVFLCL